ncbi:hypothetical protein D3C84_665010 [compost metagenome]
MTEGVVDAFEVVQVQVKHRKGRSTSSGRGEGLVQAFDQGRSVGQSGQCVRACQQGDFFFGQPSLGDIEDDPFHFDQLALVVAYGDIAVFHPAKGAITDAHAEFDRRSCDITIQGAEHGILDFGLVVRVYQCLSPVGRGHQLRRHMAELGDVVGNVHQRERRLAPQAIEDGGAVLDDDVGVGQLSGTLLDRLFQLVPL